MQTSESQFSVGASGPSSISKSSSLNKKDVRSTGAGADGGTTSGSWYTLMWVLYTALKCFLVLQTSFSLHSGNGQMKDRLLDVIWLPMWLLIRSCLWWVLQLKQRNVFALTSGWTVLKWFVNDWYKYSVWLLWWHLGHRTLRWWCTLAQWFVYWFMFPSISWHWKQARSILPESEINWNRKL